MAAMGEWRCMYLVGVESIIYILHNCQSNKGHVTS